MKIAHVRDVAHVARHLVAGLARLGHTCELFLLPESTELRLGPKALHLARILPRVLGINARIRRGRFDVVHLHAANSGWIAALGGYPYFVHCHGSEVRRDLHQPVRQHLVRYTLRRALHVFFVTPDLAEHVHAVRTDATLLPNPIDTDLFAPPTAPAPDDGPVRVLIAAPLTRIKGPEIAHQAVEMARRAAGVPVMVSALATGRSVARLRYLLERPDIEPVGRRPHTQMPVLYGGFDVVVGQMRLGCLSLIELEAMACGRPLVAYCDLAAYARHYAEPPPVLSAATAEEAAAHIGRLIADAALRRAVGEASRAWVVRYHGLEPVARELEARYREHLG